MSRISIGTFSFNPTMVEYATDVIESGMLSTGKYIEQFESAVAKMYGKKYAIMVNSGQSALEVALEYTKIKFGKECRRCYIPATTYMATLWAAERVRGEGLCNVFGDIDNNYVFDFSSLDSRPYEEDIFLPVDLCGYSSREAGEFAKSRGMYVIQDACEAFGNLDANYGDIICFSFYVSHIITTGSGGMCISDDKDFYEFAQKYIAHGRSLGGDFTKFSGAWEDRFKFEMVGASYRSNNLDAAIGLAGLQDLDWIIKKRKTNAKILIDNPVKGFVFPDLNYWQKCVFQFFPILCEEGINREHLLQFLYSKGIDSRVLLSMTNQKPFKEIYGDIEDRYPFSKICNDHGFIIGCHQNLHEEDMRYILDTLNEYRENHAKLD